VDVDTGFGASAHNIARTVKSLIKFGAAAMHMEDQVGAKRCGHRPNKELVSQQEMVDRVKAAADAKTDSAFVVMARTDPAAGSRGISAFILERGMPGFRPGQRYKKLGLHASDTAELILEGVRVPKANLLGEKNRGFHETKRVLEGGRIAMAAMAVGLAQGALDQAVKYAKERQAFGQPIAHFQGIQGMLADLATEVEAARLLTLRAAYGKDRGRPVMAEASMAKVFASEVGMKCATKAVQIHGGYGYTREFPVERFFRDVKLCEIGEGTSEVQRMVIARHLLESR